MISTDENWFKNPPRLWLAVCGLSGGLYSVFLLKYGAISYLTCALFGAIINTYNFPKLLLDKSVAHLVIALMQISILLGVVGSGVAILIFRSGVLSFPILIDFIWAATISQLISFAIMKIWSSLVKKENSYQD